MVWLLLRLSCGDYSIEFDSSIVQVTVHDYATFLKDLNNENWFNICKEKNLLFHAGSLLQFGDLKKENHKKIPAEQLNQLPEEKKNPRMKKMQLSSDINSRLLSTIRFMSLLKNNPVNEKDVESSGMDMQTLENLRTEAFLKMKEEFWNTMRNHNILFVEDKKPIQTVVASSKPVQAYVAATGFSNPAQTFAFS